MPSPAGRACDAAQVCPTGFFCLEGACAPECDDPRVGKTCSAGKGQCRAEGAWVCTAQQEVVCTATAGAASAEACDGVDNDCNGIVDDASGCVSTAARSSSPGYAEGPLVDARFHGPHRILPLPNGDLLVSEATNHVIRRLSLATGTVTLEAGIPGTCGSKDGPLGVGELCAPAGMAVGADGTVYIADEANESIRMLRDGVLSVLAGTGAGGFADGPAAEAMFDNPIDLALDGTSLYVADRWNCRLRVVSTTGLTVSTAAGTNCDDPGVKFYAVESLVLAPDGTVYLADHTPAIWSFRGGQVQHLAGKGYGYNDGMGVAASFRIPAGMSATETGLYVADPQSHRIRFVTYAGEVSTVAGTGVPGYREGAASGTALMAEPTGVAAMGGNLYFVGKVDHRVRKLDLQTRQVSAVTGRDAALYEGEGPMAEVSSPAGISTDLETGIAYFSDRLNHAIRALHPDGTVRTVAGTGVPGFKDGPQQLAQFSSPKGLRVTPDGKLIVADSQNHRIRQIDLVTGLVTTLAGLGHCDDHEGDGLFLAGLCSPSDIALGSDGAIYIADAGTSSIRMLKGGQITTFAGELWAEASRDGFGTEAWFFRPQGIEFGPDGLLYVADSENSDIRTVDPVTREVVTLVGTHTCGDQAGPIGQVPPPTLCRPVGLAFSGSDLFIVSGGTGRIYKLSEANLRHVAGRAWEGGSRDGANYDATFHEPWGIAPAPGGGFFVTESVGGRIRRVMP